jgi:hypothetical protein
VAGGIEMQPPTKPGRLCDEAEQPLPSDTVVSGLIGKAGQPAEFCYGELVKLTSTELIVEPAKVGQPIVEPVQDRGGQAVVALFSERRRHRRYHAVQG